MIQAGTCEVYNGEDVQARYLCTGSDCTDRARLVIFTA